jgi:hypothetical protein
MVLARQALFGGISHHAAHHAAERVLGQDVVTDIVGHWSVPGTGKGSISLKVASARRKSQIPAGVQPRAAE